MNIIGRIILSSCFMIVCASVKSDNLDDVLMSPKATMNLYREFKAEQHLHFAKSEDKSRYRLFRETAKFVASANQDPEDEAKYELNFFSTMTPEERKLYRGINATLGRQLEEKHSSPATSRPVAVPAKKIWMDSGAVTRVKDQGICGSCWAFSATAAIETQYWRIGGKLRDFSDHEIAACSLENWVDQHGNPIDGCVGAWPEEGFKYLQKGHRLAATKDYPYTAGPGGKTGKCKAEGKPNAFISAKVTGIEYAKTEQKTIELLATRGPLSVAFEVTTYSEMYKSGILRDKVCSNKKEGIEVNHGVALVGYTPVFVIVKNSYGTGWGLKGFAKFARGHHNCELFVHSHYPVMERTGRRDNTPSDPASRWWDDNNDDIVPTKEQVDPNCKDALDDCNEHPDDCKNAQIRDWVKKMCPKYCGFCTPEKCESGAIRCPDGVCRHPHRC